MFLAHDQKSSYRTTLPLEHFLVKSMSFLIKSEQFFILFCSS